jgi:hypothetical protein
VRVRRAEFVACRVTELVRASGHFVLCGLRRRRLDKTSGGFDQRGAPLGPCNHGHPGEDPEEHTSTAFTAQVYQHADEEMIERAARGLETAFAAAD